MSTDMIILVVVVASLSTLVWRIAGVAIAERLSLQHPLYEWFVHVSYGAVAAVLCLNVFFSGDGLDANELARRLIAITFGLIATKMRSTRVFLGFCVSVSLYSVFVYFSLTPYDLLTNILF